VPVVPLVPLVSLVSAMITLLASVLVPPSPPCLLAPVEAPIVDPYRDPRCVWCPGNRGLTYGTAPGASVRAAAAGTVAFSGVVAGTRYVVVQHADGVRATYGGLEVTDLRAGDPVVAGGVIGRSAGELHFGLRRGDAYLDPTPLIGRLVERRRLVPTDGTPARTGPPPRLRCAASGTG